MESLFLLIPLSVLALGVAAWLFLRMSGDGQFDEGEGPAWRVLMDDDRPSRGHVRGDDDPAPPTGERPSGDPANR